MELKNLFLELFSHRMTVEGCSLRNEVLKYTRPHAEVEIGCESDLLRKARSIDLLITAVTTVVGILLLLSADADASGLMTERRGNTAAERI